MESLIQYILGYFKERDSLSLFVEYCGNDHVRVHSQFYNYNQFKSLFIEYYKDPRGLELRDVTDDISHLNLLCC